LRAAMLAWEWPGNVRELENVVRKLLIFRDVDASARELQARAIRRYAAAGVGQSPRTPSSEQPEEFPILAQVTRAKQQAEADAILNALSATRWNRKQASVLLKIDYKALLYKMKKLGMDNTAHSDDVTQSFRSDADQNGAKRRRALS